MRERRMDGEQMSLLTWTPPAKVSAFPASRLVSKVRETADGLMRRNGKDAERFWRRRIDALALGYVKAGFDRETIKREARAFHDAVQAEMVRAAYSPARRPDGAA